MPARRSRALPVAPDSVRVWRGYALDRTQKPAFWQTLGSTFIPITAQVMGKLGLTAYLPAIVPDDAAPSVPDEIALVFYRSQAEYQENANGTTAGRAYQKLHAGVFVLGPPRPGQQSSASSFPLALGDTCVPGQPYYLFADAVDWYHGDSDVYVGVFDGDMATLAAAVVAAAKALQAGRPAGLDGLILTVVDTVFICWRHWRSGPAGAPWDINVALRQVMFARAAAANVEPSEYAPFSGLAAGPGQYLNVHFRRA